jgi:hypothetical protein
MIPMSEWAKSFHASDCAATVNGRRKYNLMKIKVPDIQNSLKEKLCEAVSQIESIGEGVEEKWMKIKSVLNDICENTTGYQKKITYGYQTTYGIFFTRGGK